MTESAMHKRVRAIFGDDSGTFKYKAEPAGLYMLDLARKAAFDLGIGDIEMNVFTIRECEPGEQPDVTKSTAIAGLCESCGDVPINIYVKEGLDYRQMHVVLGHEMHHAFELSKGRVPSETEADKYGAMFARWQVDGIRA